MDRVYGAIDGESEVYGLAGELHAGARQLEKQSAGGKKLDGEARRANVTLDRANDSATNALKQVGDLRNWFDMLAEEVGVLERAVASHRRAR
ncbi:ATP-binding mismatch repair protein [Savitreella phatthalungensis]